MEAPKRFRVIACEILYRELCLCAAKSNHIVDLTFLPKGLHDMGAEKMRKKLQEEINKTQWEKYDAVLLGYGLCNNGTAGLSAKIPLVLPRAHDCITLLLGSGARYSELFGQNPGTFYKSPGWIEREIDFHDNPESTTSQLGMNQTYLEYVEKFGEENAKFLMETLGGWTANYSRLVYIDTGLGNRPFYEADSKKAAGESGWELETVAGDVSLLAALTGGAWEESAFLVVPPGEKVAAVYGQKIVESQK